MEIGNWWIKKTFQLKFFANKSVCISLFQFNKLKYDSRTIYVHLLLWNFARGLICIRVDGEQDNFELVSIEIGLVLFLCWWVGSEVFQSTSYN